MTTTTHENPRCPDYSSHSENAADRLFPELGGSSARFLSVDQMDLVDAAAEAEYQNCEGH